MHLMPNNARLAHFHRTSFITPTFGGTPIYPTVPQDIANLIKIIKLVHTKLAIDLCLSAMSDLSIMQLMRLILKFHAAVKTQDIEIRP